MKEIKKQIVIDNLTSAISTSQKGWVALIWSEDGNFRTSEIANCEKDEHYYDDIYVSEDNTELIKDLILEFS